MVANVTPDEALGAALAALRDGNLAEAERLLLAADAARPDHADTLLALGVVLFRQGRGADAVAALDRAAPRQELNALFHNNRGTILHELARFEDAELAFRRAVELEGGFAAGHRNLGNALMAQGRALEAEVCFRQALSLKPDFVDALVNLAGSLNYQGRLEEAEPLLRRAVEIDPGSVEALVRLADLHHGLGRSNEAANIYRKVLEAQPYEREALMGLAHVLHTLGRADEAMRVLEPAAAAMPDDEDLAFTLRFIASSLVPGWHIPMINDTERNEAYFKALKNAVTPGSLVLEIGTGSGIVAMAAAKFGARQVVTCEMNTALARVAAETVRRNGLSEKVSVVAKKSTLLKVPRDLPEKADVFVSELLNIGMLAPEMLAVLRHARTHLVKPEGKVIPAAARVFAQPIEAPDLARVVPVATVEGFDLSAFDVFRTPGYQVFDMETEDYKPLGPAQAVLDFDFRADMPDLGRRLVDFPIDADGTLHAIAFWFDLFMDEEVIYHSASRSRTNHWRQAAEFFVAKPQVKAGTSLSVIAGWDRTRIYFKPV